MEFLNRNQINTTKWDQAIAKSEIENIFCYSWYLDSTSQYWGAIVTKDYKTILPIPYSKKIGLKQMYQPPFTRELDIIGDDFNWPEALTFLKKNFKSIQFRSSCNNLIQNAEERKHQILNYNQEIKYSTNAKRLIKKANKNFSIQQNGKVESLIELFKKTAFKKIDSISEKDLMTLTNLMNTAIAKGYGEIIEAKEKGKVVGAGFFLKDKSRITYLKGASTEETKKQGVMYGLVNFAIEKHKSHFNNFDFGGSNIDSVANFYKKFGAKDRKYYNYTINKLPSWFKALKKIKK